jgi:hypothetical protein
MDEPREFSLNLLEHKIGFALKTPEEQALDSQDKLAGQVWVKPRSNSSNLVSGMPAQPKDKCPKQLSKTIPQEEDQLVFKEMLQCYIQIDQESKDKYNSNRVAKEAAKIINGFSSLKSQIEDLKSLFIQLKKENQGSSKQNQFKGKISKQGANASSYKELTRAKHESPSKKKSQTGGNMQPAKATGKRCASNSKRSASQKATFRASLFGKSNLNGSMEAIDKNSIYSSEKQLIHRPKVDLDKFKSIYSRFTLSRPLDGERRSLKSSIRKCSSRTSGVKQVAAKSKVADSNGQYIENIIGNLTKPPLFSGSKRTAEILSLININNLYSTMPSEEGLKRKIRKKFTSPNKSLEKGGQTGKKLLESAAKARDSCEDIRMSTNSTRVRSKKQVGKDSSKEISKKESSTMNSRKNTFDRSTYFTKTERGPMSAKNPLQYSLTKWEKQGERIPSQDRSVTNIYSETETDKVRSSINSEHHAYQTAPRPRYSHLPGCLATSSYLMKKPSSTTKCSTPAGQSLPKTSQSDRTEEMRPSNTEKQRIIHHLSKLRDGIEPKLHNDRRESGSHVDKGRKQVVVYREMINLAEGKSIK